MLSAPDKALLVKLFYMNQESATIALRKFQVQKNVKSGKGPLTPAGLLKLVKRLEETGKLEDRAQTGRPCLKEACAPCIAVEMEAIASEAASWTSSAREAARRLGLPSSSVRNILRRLLQLYPYKLQSCHELLPADTAQREAFAKWAFSKMEQDPTWVFNILWRDEAHFSLHGPFFFETQCPVNGWITETVIAHRYLTLLRETVVPCLIQRGQISNVTFMQDGATSHTANPIKTFLIQTFGEDRIVSRCCRYPWPPRSPDLTPADFWLWGYLKSRVYLSGPSSLPELKYLIRREVSSIHPDMLHSVVAGFVTRLECLLPCGGGHVEHILVFVEWAQNEIAVVPDFHKRILFSDEAHFWLNGYINKQNCPIWSEANPQVYVETLLHPEKLTVWCDLWAGGILLQKRWPQRYSQW
ncbi:DUF4817 domain-containing protein [Trichonephila clavipes]|nr:DUF4817 domain-containing protein [Trichonephila clavipes]